MTLTVQPTGAVNAGTSHRLNEATLAEVARRVASIGVGLAHADWSFDWGWQQSAQGVFSVDLTMQLTMEMPVWSRKSSRPLAEQREWDRFLRALRQHEDGHHVICRREVQVMYRAMNGANQTNVQSVHNREGARIDRLNVEYDRSTDHGRRQTGPHGDTVINVP